MDCKKLIVSSLAAALVLCAANVNAQELTAKVQKSYLEIDKLIEYNHYQEADKLLKEALQHNPNDIDARALKAVSLAKQFKLAPAQKELDSLLPKYPKNADLHYAQGLVYMMRQTSSDVEYIKSTRSLINQAIKEFVTAVNLDSNYYQAYNALGVATMKLGNYKDAKELFNVAIQINPQYATAYDNLGNLEMLNGNLAEAEALFNKSLKFNSTNPTAMYHLAQVAVRQGDYSKALTWINHSLHIHPNSAPALTLQGEIYQVQGNQAAAINSYKKAVTVKPETSRAYINLANVYEKRADSEFAMEQLKTVLAINPNYTDGVMKVANLSLATRKYEQALDYYSRLLNDTKYGNDAIVGLANTYYEMTKDKGDSDDITTQKELYVAYDYINKAIEKCPDDLELHLAKLKIAKLTNQSVLSKESLNYIIQSASNTMMDSVIKGEAYLALGREKDAVYTFENAINFSTNVDDDIYLAEILLHNKQFKTARLALKKALMRDADSQMAKNMMNYIDICEIKSNEFFDIAQHQFKEKNYASTIEYCNRAIDFYHNNGNIAKLKAQAYEKELNYRGAIKYYTQYLSFYPNAEDKEQILKKIEKFKKKAQ